MGKNLVFGEDFFFVVMYPLGQKGIINTAMGDLEGILRTISPCWEYKFCLNNFSTVWHD